MEPRQDDDVPAIADGVKVMDRTQHPHAARIMSKFTKTVTNPNPPPKELTTQVTLTLAGGILISNRHVLTSATAVTQSYVKLVLGPSYSTLTTLQIFLGDLGQPDSASPSQRQQFTVPVNKVISHPSFVSPTTVSTPTLEPKIKYNLAVIVLGKNVTINAYVNYIPVEFGVGPDMNGQLSSVADWYIQSLTLIYMEYANFTGITCPDLQYNFNGSSQFYFTASASNYISCFGKASTKNCIDSGDYGTGITVDLPQNNNQPPKRVAVGIVQSGDCNNASSTYIFASSLANKEHSDFVCLYAADCTNSTIIIIPSTPAPKKQLIFNYTMNALNIFRSWLG